MLICAYAQSFEQPGRLLHMDKRQGAVQGLLKDLLQGDFRLSQELSGQASNRHTTNQARVFKYDNVTAA